MKRIGLFTSIGLLALAMAATPAMAQGQQVDYADKNGAFGLGGNTTLGGVNGLHIRTYVTPLFGVAGTIGFHSASTTVNPDGDSNSVETSSLSFEIGLWGNYKIAFWQRGSLSVIFGVDIVTLSEDLTRDTGEDTSRSGTDVLIGLGLMGEWFPTQYLSLFAEVGLRIDIIGGDEVINDGGVTDDGSRFTNTAENTSYSGLELDLMSDLFGTAGFTVWFQ